MPNTAEAITELDIREEDVERTVSPELADELRYAPLANLKGHAVSEQAIALVQHLAHKYPRGAQGVTRTTRANKPRKLEPNYQRAVAAFLAELLAARAEEGAPGWLRLSLNKENYSRKSGALVSYRIFDHVRQAWTVAGLIEERKGYLGRFKFGNPGPMQGRMSRFRATQSLLAICSRHHVTPERVTEHFHIEFEMPRELLQLTSPVVPTQDTPTACRLREEGGVERVLAHHTLT